MTQKGILPVTCPNIWIEKSCVGHMLDLFKKRRMDYIPARCKEADGVVLISMTQEEIHKIVASYARGVFVDSTGTVTARILGTEILVDVISIHPMEIK